MPAIGGGGQVEVLGISYIRKIAIWMKAWDLDVLRWRLANPLIHLAISSHTCFVEVYGWLNEGMWSWYTGLCFLLLFPGSDSMMDYQQDVLRCKRRNVRNTDQHGRAA